MSVGKDAPAAPMDLATLINAQKSLNLETAREQGAQNRQTAIQQAGLNMIGQSTPYGALNYKQVGTWEDGTPRYEAATTLSPEMQRLFKTGTSVQGNIGQTALDMTGRLGSTVAPVTTPTLQTDLGGDFSMERQKVEDALMARMQPNLDLDRSRIEQRLADQGIRIGSGAWDTAMDQFDRSVNDARLGAVINAGQEQNRMQSLALNKANFGNNALQTDFTNRLTAQGTDLNNLMALAGGSQVQLPQFQSTPQTGVAPTQIAGVDAIGAANSMYGNQLNAWGMGQQAQGGMFGSLIGAGGMLGGAAILSDERAKEDIREVGETHDGQPIYLYRYKGDPTPRMGLIAQDVMEDHPEAVVPMGALLGIDYDRALEAA